MLALCIEVWKLVLPRWGSLRVWANALPPHLVDIMSQAFHRLVLGRHSDDTSTKPK